MANENCKAGASNIRKAQTVAILCSTKGASLERVAHFSYKRCQKKSMLVTAVAHIEAK